MRRDLFLSARPFAFEIFLGFFERHDVRVFVMEIEVVDLMRQRAAVKDTFSTTVT
jgi:hypothetical protein